MFFPEGQVRVFLYGQPVNMHLSFDGLYALAKHVMHQDPSWMTQRYRSTRTTSNAPCGNP